MRIRASQLARSTLAMGLVIAFGCGPIDYASGSSGDDGSGSSGADSTDDDVLVAHSTDGGVTWAAPTALNANAAGDAADDRWPQVTTDGQGAWVAVWRSWDSLGDTIGTDDDILMAHSTDGGATWSAPAALNANADSDAGIDSRPQLTTDEQGTWVAVWHSTDSLGDTIGTDWDVLVAHSTDDGATWTAPAALNANAASDAGIDAWPQVTTDGQGDWIAAWSSDDSLGDTIGTDADILVARSTDGGATWTEHAVLNTNAASDAGGDNWPQITTDGQGDWVAVWRSGDSLGDTIGTDLDILVANSTDGGATWSAPAALNANAASDAEDDGLPQLTTDGKGIWIAIWPSWGSLGDTIGTDADILVARSTDKGFTWSAPAALNANASTDLGYDGAPQLTTDGQGTWIAIWSSGDSLGDTIGTDWDILVARSVDDGVTWTAPAALDANAASDAESDTLPQLTTDAQGTWVAVWEYEDPL